MAYAALALLIHDLKEISLSDQDAIYLKKECVESLEEEASFLLSFLNDSQEKEYDQEMLNELDEQIRDVCHRAADYIDSNIYIRNMLRTSTPFGKEGWIKLSMVAQQSFMQIIEEIQCIKTKVVKFCENTVPRREVLAGRNPSVQDSPFGPPSSEEKLVGIDGDIDKLLLRIAEPTSRLQVIPITGMGGIGKTTLARQIYNHPYAAGHFYVRSWIAISEGLAVSVAYQVRAMLLGILKCLISITDEIRLKENEDLGEQVYKNLIGISYLVVLDDMWDTNTWDKLRMYFPDEGNGSRIILTTRVAEVAIYANPDSSPHCMRLLRDSESWKLMESKLFPKESCPPELIETGKRIAARCQGLPLAVVVVAGLFSKMNKTIDTWTKIAEDVDTLVSKDPNRCLDILAFSYNCLPNVLRACFLYMGAFRRDCNNIPTSQLIRLWVAEGFIHQATNKSLEDIAETYLEDLVSRNLVLVGKRRSDGTIKTCYIHNLLHDLCVRESKKEKFLRTIKTYTLADLAEHQRRIGLHASVLHYFYSLTSIPLTRSFLCFDVSRILPDFFLLEFMHHVGFGLLRVLDIMLLRSNHFPIEIVSLFHLRYLALAVNSELPGSISKLQKLQTLIVDHIWERQSLPSEIWNMPQLRHVHLIRGCYFPRCRVIGNRSPSALKNLQTLSTLMGSSSCSKELFACFPRLRKLKIFGTASDSAVNWHSECLDNLPVLIELETFKCYFLYRPRKLRLPDWNLLPRSLKRLTLSGSYMPWKEMAKLGMLPNLEELKVRHNAFDGDSWKPAEDGFPQLKLLLIDNSDPSLWEADCSHFPSLKRLVLVACQRLQEIPEGIGEICTLEVIELHECNMFLANSTRQVHEHQLLLGNDALKIKISWGDNRPPPETNLFS